MNTIIQLVFVAQFFSHFIPGHPRPMECPHLTWMDTAMHGQPTPHAADRPPTRLGEPSTVPGRVVGGGQSVLSFEQ